MKFPQAAQLILTLMDLKCTATAGQFILLKSKLIKNAINAALMKLFVTRPSHKGVCFPFVENAPMLL